MGGTKQKVKVRSPRKPDADLLAWRKEFPILAKTVYLISHSMGAMPRGAAERLGQYAKEWSTLGIAAYDRWLPALRETADLVASLIGARPGTVCFHQNVSTLVSVILSAITQPGGRRKVVYTDLNFPSIHYVWSAHQKLGIQLHIVESPDGIEIPTERMVKAIDEQTLAVVIDHGIFRSSSLQDVEAIARAARQRGTYSIVDAYQTVGCVPVDVERWGIDFLVAGSHKWLCGGPGASFLYVRPELIPRLEPRVTGWFSHERPMDFAWDMQYAKTAMRFATGTPNLAGVYAARAGIEIIASVGVERIREKSVRLTSQLIERAEEQGLRVNSPRDSHRRGGFVAIDFPGADKAVGKLQRKGIHVDYRPNCGIRVSPHFYTTDEELFSILPEIEKLRRKR